MAFIKLTLNNKYIKNKSLKRSALDNAIINLSKKDSELKIKRDALGYFNIMFKE